MFVTHRPRRTKPRPTPGMSSRALALLAGKLCPKPSGKGRAPSFCHGPGSIFLPAIFLPSSPPHLSAIVRRLVSAFRFSHSAFSPWLSAFLLVLPLAAAVTPETVPRQDFWQANGPVHAVAVTNGVIYIGGAFGYVGPPGRKIAGYDLYTAAPDGRWPSISGSSVHAIIPDDAGGWYIGGSFNEVSGQPRTNLAHVFGSGQLDPDFQPNPDGVVKTLALGDDTLFVGGEF